MQKIIIMNHYYSKYLYFKLLFIIYYFNQLNHNFQPLLINISCYYKINFVFIIHFIILDFMIFVLLLFLLNL